MKKLLTFMAMVLLLGGCVAYPGYGYYDRGYYPYYPYAYGYAVPSVNFFVTDIHGGHFSHHGFRGGGFRGGFRH